MPDKLENLCLVGQAVQPLQSVKNYSNSRVPGYGHARRFHARGRFYQKCWNGLDGLSSWIWLMVGKWTGCSLVVSKKIDYLCINLLNYAFNLLTVFTVNIAFCKRAIKPSLSSLAWINNCIHFPTTCWVHSMYSRLYALWWISRWRRARELRILWRGVLWRLCELGRVLHSIACGHVEWPPRDILVSAAS